MSSNVAALARKRPWTRPLILLLAAGLAFVVTLSLGTLIRDRPGGGFSVSGLVARVEARQIAPKDGDVVRVRQRIFVEREPDPLADPYHLRPPSNEVSYSDALLRLGKDGAIVERHLLLADAAGEVLQEEYSIGTSEYDYDRLANRTDVLELPTVATYAPPIKAHELSEQSGLTAAGSEKSAVETLDLFESPFESGGVKYVRQWGVSRSDDQLVMRRRLRINSDGTRTPVEERVVLDILVNPSLGPDAFAFQHTSGSAQAAAPSGTEATFSLPPDEEITQEQARVQSSFDFLAPQDGVTDIHVFRGSQPSLVWDSLTVDQRNVQYATGISGSYRITANTLGGSVIIVEGSPAELGRILAETPPLWSHSKQIDVRSPTGATSVWVGGSEDGSASFIAGIVKGTLVAVAGFGLSEDQVSNVFSNLK